MRRRSRAGPERAKSRRRKTVTQKRRGQRNPSAAGSKAQSDVAQLRRERDEALEREKATAEVLRIISSSPGELEPVFQTMLANAVRICGGKFGIMFGFADGTFRALSSLGVPPALLIQQPQVGSEHPHNPLTRVAESKAVLHIPDLTMDQAYIKRNPRIVALVESGGARNLLVVPMLKDEVLVGAM